MDNEPARNVISVTAHTFVIMCTPQQVLVQGCQPVDKSDN